MLRFFRTIRKKLMEQNKIRTYFLYAIGEIFLVVVGILIALQVNNWNEQRKQDKLKQEYTVSMISDLKQDLIQIKEFQEYNTEQLRLLDTLQTYLNLNVKSPKGIRDLQFVPNFSTLSSLNNNTFLALRNSGNLDLYKINIRNALIRHNGLQKDYIASHELNERVFYETMNRYIYSAPLSGDSLTVLPTILREEIWKDLDYHRHAISFNGLTLQKRFLLNVFNQRYDSLLSSTKNILKMLEENQ